MRLIRGYVIIAMASGDEEILFGKGMNQLYGKFYSNGLVPYDNLVDLNYGRQSLHEIYPRIGTARIQMEVAGTEPDLWILNGHLVVISRYGGEEAQLIGPDQAVVPVIHLGTENFRGFSSIDEAVRCARMMETERSRAVVSTIEFTRLT